MLAHSQVRVATMATILLCLAAAAGLVLVAVAVREILAWLFIALFLASVANPLVDLLSRRWSRGLSVLAVVAVATAVLASILVVVVPALVDQVRGLAKVGPQLERLLLSSTAFQRLDVRFHIVALAQREVAALPQVLSQTATGVFSVLGKVLHGAVGGVTVFFVAIFLLLDYPALTRSVLGVFRPATRARVARIGHAVYWATSRYALGTLAIAGIAGTVATVLLALAGVPYYLPLGLCVGLLGLIPFVGAVTGAGLVSIVAWAAVGWARAAFVLAALVVYQQIENHVLQPLVHRYTVRLSALAIAVALLVGASLAGLFGAVFAIPVAGALHIVLRESLNLIRERRADRMKPPEGPPPKPGGDPDRVEAH
jgi:predicted PurR-regulated permease PerM